MTRRTVGTGMFSRHVNVLSDDEALAALISHLDSAVAKGGFDWRATVAPIREAAQQALDNAPAGGWRERDEPQWWLAQIALEIRMIEAAEKVGDFALGVRSAIQLGQRWTEFQAKIVAEPAWYYQRTDAEKRRNAQKAARDKRMEGKPGNSERALAVDEYLARNPGATRSAAGDWLHRNRPELGSAQTIRKAR